MQGNETMYPARSMEEAAMYPAKAHTLTGGAALKMVMARSDCELVTVEVPVNTQEAAQSSCTENQAAAAARNRAALYHVIRHSF